MDRGTWQVIVHGHKESDTTERLTLSLSIFPGGSVVKNPPPSRRHGFNPWLRKWKPIPKCSCLENSMDRGTWQVTVHGVAKELDTT